MTAAEFETSLQDKNDLRRASGLPLCDVEKELARFHADQQAAAYAAFVWNDCLSLNSCAARSGLQRDNQDDGGPSMRMRGQARFL